MRFYKKYSWNILCRLDTIAYFHDKEGFLLAVPSTQKLLLNELLNEHSKTITSLKLELI